MNADLIHCPRCGATPAHPPDSTGSYLCAYCGSRFQARQHVPVPVPFTAPPRKASAVPALLIGCGAIGVLAMVGIGVAAFAFARIGADASSPPRTSARSVRLSTAPTVRLGNDDDEARATGRFELHNRIAGYKSSYYVLGMVTNTSPFVIAKPKVVVVLVGADGKEIATRDGYADADAMKPGAAAPVKILVSDPPPHDRMTFEVAARKATYVPEQSQGLDVQILEQPAKTFGNSWSVSGKVFNRGSSAAKFVKVDVLSYDAQQHLIGLDFTYTDDKIVDPNSAARFRAMLTLDRAPTRVTYMVSGRPAR